MELLNHTLDRTFLGNAVWQWLMAAGGALLFLLVALTVRRSVRKQAERLAATDRVELLELPFYVAARTRMLFILVVAAIVAARLLDLPDRAVWGASVGLTVVGFWQAGLWATAAASVWIAQRRRAALQADRATAGTLGIIELIVRGLIWTLVLLLALDNLGINVTALVAGLGVGGIAVALAVQNLLGDLFASLSITLDRPFVLGDFIIVDDFMGSVEHIGIKSVRLRSLSGEQIVMSNADLLSSRVRNYGRMHERRVVFSINIRFETSREKLQAIPALIRGLIESQPGTRFDRSHFASYGDFALRFETVYYVLSPDYNVYMDIQQGINLGIHAMLERENVELAYPAQRFIPTPQLSD
jgi:small-conductance mechanosensitive channel